MSIVRIFETGHPFGDYAACVVLNDGAGVSYGISQFTHRSGALLAVVEKYLANGGTIARVVLEDHLSLLRSRSVAAIRSLAANHRFEKALKAAAVSQEMQAAQENVAFERYLKPAVGACEGSGFVLPLSLAVIYDSMTHGSWEKIRGRVRIAAHGGCPRSGEKAWITEYVSRRDLWLASIPRLRSTRYRTRFFLTQIALGRWDLELPLEVHGISLSERTFKSADAAAGFKESAVEPALTISPGESHNLLPEPSTSSVTQSGTSPITLRAQTPADKDEDLLDQVEDHVNRAAAKYDQVERIVQTAVRRTDAAKSLWTTVVGTLWQSAWALFGMLTGMPRGVWLVAAVIAGVLTVAYLYRQIALGKIREEKIKI